MAENININGNEPDITENEEKHNLDNNFLLPPSNWVYFTPPMQKIKKPKLKRCSIQTAVMCKTNIAENEMYELKPNIKVDMSKFANLKDIPCDPRYMRKIMFDQGSEGEPEYETVLEPSRQTKFVSRHQMGHVAQESAKKLKRNLFTFETN